MEQNVSNFLIYTSGGDVFRVKADRSIIKQIMEVDLNKMSFLMVRDDEDKQLILNLRTITAVRPN